MKRTTFLIVTIGLILSFALGVITGVTGTKVIYLSDGYEKTILEMSAVPPALPPHLKASSVKEKIIPYEEVLRQFTGKTTSADADVGEE